MHPNTRTIALHWGAFLRSDAVVDNKFYSGIGRKSLFLRNDLHLKIYVFY